jgi:hypothetical protein
MRDSLERERCQIVDVIQSEGIELRPRGRELVGMCPFHGDRRPSLWVNPEKNVWHCFPCGMGGDGIRFIEKLHGVPFKDAIKLLGLNGNSTPPPRRADPARTKAKRIAQWAQDRSRRICQALCEISDEIYMCSLARKEPNADAALIAEHHGSLIRQWAILCDLDNDLNEPENAIELYGNREEIDAFVEGLL